MYVTLPLRNLGGDCVLRLPGEIGVAGATGSPVIVKVVDAGTTTAKGDNTPAMSARIRAGHELSIEIGAWWGGFGAPSACYGAIHDVTRVELPLATGALLIDLPTVFQQVCTSPASVSLMIEGFERTGLVGRTGGEQSARALAASEL